jgi:signal peptidase
VRPIVAAAQLVRRILDVLLLLLIVVCLLGVALGKLVPLTGSQALAIGGASMSPAIPVGAAVIVTRVPVDQLAVGDVVSLVAGQSRSVFTHRIIAIVDGDRGIAVRTRGDANDAADPTLVPEADILGRVTGTIPYAGYLITLLSLPVGVAFVLGLALALLACAWLLESIELRGVARRRRVLRKIPAWRPTLSDGWLPAGPAMGASGVGTGVAAHLGGTGHPLAATARPAGAGWVLPGRVVPVSRPGRRR